MILETVFKLSSSRFNQLEISVVPDIPLPKQTQSLFYVVSSIQIDSGAFKQFSIKK